MSFDLELGGRRALVTAGTRGVGAAVVAALCDAGVNVVSTARSISGTAPNGVHYQAELTALAWLYQQGMRWHFVRDAIG